MSEARCTCLGWMPQPMGPRLEERQREDGSAYIVEMGRDTGVSWAGLVPCPVHPPELIGEHGKLIADGYVEVDSLGMTNFDHSVDTGLAKALRSGKVYVQHSAWDHCGYVWWDGKQFVEEVWVHHEPRQVMRAKTLRSLMRKVNDKYGEG